MRASMCKECRVTAIVYGESIQAKTGTGQASAICNPAVSSVNGARARGEFTVGVLLHTSGGRMRRGCRNESWRRWC